MSRQLLQLLRLGVLLLLLQLLRLRAVGMAAPRAQVHWLMPWQPR